MKFKKSDLNNIINEEIDNVIKEQEDLVTQSRIGQPIISPSDPELEKLIWVRGNSLENELGRGLSRSERHQVAVDATYELADSRAAAIAGRAGNPLQRYADLASTAAQYFGQQLPDRADYAAAAADLERNAAWDRQLAAMDRESAELDPARAALGWNTAAGRGRHIHVPPRERISFDAERELARRGRMSPSGRSGGPAPFRNLPGFEGGQAPGSYDSALPQTRLRDPLARPAPADPPSEELRALMNRPVSEMPELDVPGGDFFREGKEFDQLVEQIFEEFVKQPS